jgi:hypothetical protein
MTESSGGGASRVEIERRLINRSLEEEEFRQRLLADPKGTVEQQIDSWLPESMELRVVEENAQTIYLVLPSASPIGSGGAFSRVALGDQHRKSPAGLWND